MKKIHLSVVTAVLMTTNLYAVDEDLGTITVSSATKSEQSIKDVTSNLNVITNIELEEKHLTTVTEALNLISGVNFSTNGGLGGSTELNIRGTSNNRVLVLIDGVKFKDHSSISGTDISNLLVNEIEKIEVIKGAQSGIWGADASAGVVNIITKEAKFGVHGTIFSEVGSFNTKKYGASISHKNKNYSIKLSSTKVSSDSFTSKATRGENIDQYENDPYKNTTNSLQTTYFINDDASLGLDILNIDSLKDYDSSSANDTTMQNDSKSRMYNVVLKQRYNNHKLKLSYNTTNIKRDQIGTTWGVKLTENDSSNLELSDEILYNKNDFVLMGVGSTSDELDYEKADNTQSNAKNSSKFTYLTNSNKLNKLVLTESIRYDSYDNFKNKTTGKIGVKYTPTHSFNVFSNIGTSYSVPLLIKNINPWGATNMAINPESSKSFDLGFGYKDIKITYFYQKVTDLIDWSDPTPLNYYNNDAIYTNLDGKSTFKGIELEYQKEIFQDVLFNMNYTYLSAKDKDNQDLKKTVKDTLKYALDYYGIKKLHIGLNGEYIGSRYNDTAKTIQTGKYTVTNFTANYDISKSVKFYTKIDNITNKYYQSIDGYATSPRAYYAGVKVSF
ncbi:TonB-dependent receptor [Arcobacteraceae bacterium]|nr:TonB-dependent receptor [Arcobacteraceae bacterium]